MFLFQGDIQIDQKDVNNVIAPGHTGRKKRALAKDRTSLWQSPIYYEFSSRLDSKYCNIESKLCKSYNLH